MNTVLIVDDDPMVLESTRTYLEVQGFKTLCARDGDEALSLYQREHADLALIDIFMPKRGGFETIMALHSNLPIIAMSGTSSNRFEPLDFAESLGAKASLSKPFQPEELMTLIQRFLPQNMALH